MLNNYICYKKTIQGQGQERQQWRRQPAQGVQVVPRDGRLRDGPGRKEEKTVAVGRYRCEQPSDPAVRPVEAQDVAQVAEDVATGDGAIHVGDEQAVVVGHQVDEG